MNLSETSPSSGHARNKSSTSRSTRPRSSTRGPLDVDNDPLSAPSTPEPQRTLVAQLPRRTVSSATHGHQPTSSPILQIGEPRPKDFSFLLRPEIYHPLTPLNVPNAFRNSPKQPDPTAALDDLLLNGHFRAAAIAAVQELTGSGAHEAVNPTDSQRIFSLLYTRLMCLTLIDATPLAAQEVKALEDLSNARTYVDDGTGEHVVPWELRILNVRLQALGFGDPRRAVMSYHDLAREARDHARKAAAQHNNPSSELWKRRLHELGVLVAGALIDMDDLAGAAHHLQSLRDKGDGQVTLSKCLMWLHLGDVEHARECARHITKGATETEKLIMALCDMADGKYESALVRWQELKDSMPRDEMVGVNTAVCLLYLGRMQEGRDILEDLVDNGGFSSHTLLFNLSTMYELCTEKHRNLKMRLAERVAGMGESAAGWEKMNADFKL